MALFRMVISYQILHIFNTALFRMLVSYQNHPQFAKQLSAIIKTPFNIKILVYFTTAKTGTYLNLKCKTPFALMSNVVYKFEFSHDRSRSFIGMTNCHILNRAEEHLHFKTAVKQHIDSCANCKITNFECKFVLNYLKNATTTMQLKSRTHS